VRVAARKPDDRLARKPKKRPNGNAKSSRKKSRGFIMGDIRIRVATAEDTMK
jgi:hypothetical protein